MSTEELEAQDGADETIETVESENETSEESQDDTAKKNNSNWKKVSEKAKKADILEKKLAEAETELEEWRSSNPDIVETKTVLKKLDEMEKELFLAQSPDAEEHLDEVHELMRKYNGMDRKEAWKFIKAQKPVESKTKTEFSTKWSVNTKKKDIGSMNEEEALELNKADYAKWASKKYGF